MDWFKHDIYCLQDDRLFTLVSRYGADGYAVFFHTVEAMYANDGNPIYEMAIRRIAFELSLPFDKVSAIIDFAASENCGHLFGITEDGGFISVRVIKGVEENENKRQRYSNMGKASAERRNSTSSTQVEHRLNVGSTDKIREDKNRKDYKVSVVPSKKNLSINRKSLTNETDTLFAPSDSDESSKPTEKEEKNPVFITILSRTGEEVPIYEDMVNDWKDAYKAVDVEAELKKIKVWSKSNKTNRKSVNGMTKFINNWLSREQDRSGRFDAKTKPVKHKDYSDISDEALEKEFHWT